MTNCLLRRFLLVAGAFVFCFHTTAAQQYRSQISLTSENDNYTFQLHDRYYTNGFMIRYHKLLSPARSGAKKMLQAEMGQLIFNPYSYSPSFKNFLDRPFTGFLYAKGGVTTVSEKGHLWQWWLLAGVVGKAAWGKEVQRWHHRNFGLKYPYGWETQLQSAFGINLHGSYYHQLIPPETNQWVNVHAKATATAGTLFTGASAGLLLRVGAFERMHNSAHVDARLSWSHASFRRPFELYAFVEPALTAQVYNATLQGGLLVKNKGEFTTKPTPFYYSHSLGVVYAQNRWTTRLAFTYKTKEAARMRTHESYGSLLLGYRF